MNWITFGLMALVAPAPRLAEVPSKAMVELNKLRHEYEMAHAAFDRAYRAATTSIERADLLARQHPSVEFFPRFLSFAEKHGKDPAALEALILCLHNVRTERDRADGEWARTLKLLERDHLRSEGLGKVVRFLVGGDQHSERFLKAVLEKNPSKTVQARACRALLFTNSVPIRLADRLKKDEAFRKDYEKRIGKDEVKNVIAQAEPLRKETERLSRLFKEKYADVVKTVSVGKPAPEIKGRDLTGKETRLSDLKGKVVVLTIWASWSPVCRDLIPRQRELAKRLHGKSVALVSINADTQKETLERFLKDESLPWTHWWNGSSGGILDELEVVSLPTVIVLDHTGVIRYRDLGSGKVEDIVEGLLKQSQK